MFRSLPALGFVGLVLGIAPGCPVAVECPPGTEPGGEGCLDVEECAVDNGGCGLPAFCFRGCRFHGHLRQWACPKQWVWAGAKARVCLRCRLGSLLRWRLGSGR